MSVPDSLRGHPIFAGGRYGLLSGENPRFPAQLEPKHENLVRILKTMGLKHEEVHGRYGEPERSVLVHNPSRENLAQLGKLFGQESVVLGGGGRHELLYTNGPDEGKSRGTKLNSEPVEFFPDPPDDNYTQLPGLGYFRINFDFDQPPEHQDKVQPGLKKAIQDLPPGKPSQVETPTNGAPTQNYDYSHLLPLNLQSQFKLIGGHANDGTVGVRIYDHAGKWHGAVGGVGRNDDGKLSLDVRTSIVSPDHRNKGLGKAMYEALYSHAYHVLGVRHVTGSTHSAAATRVHQSLARQHGLDYRPRSAEGGRSRPYEYALKAELNKAIEHKDIARLPPNDQAMWDAAVEAGAEPIEHVTGVDIGRPVRGAGVGGEGQPAAWIPTVNHFVQTQSGNDVEMNRLISDRIMLAQMHNRHRHTQNEEPFLLNDEPSQRSAVAGSWPKNDNTNQNAANQQHDREFWSAVDAASTKAAATHPHSYDWHESSTEHHKVAKNLDLIQKIYGLAKAEPGADLFAKVATPYGQLTNRPTNLEHYDYRGKLPAIEALTKRHGYQYQFAGPQYGRPNLFDKNYNTGHLLVVDEPQPNLQQQADTRSWRMLHELSHALTLPQVDAIYGSGRRIGAMGSQRTLHEAQRAVHWEHLAVHKQRELSAQVGVQIPDETFHQELNTVMADAVHRALTGQKVDPASRGFLPHSHEVPLSTSLDTLRDTAMGLGLKGRHVLRKSWPRDESEKLGKAVLPEDLAHVPDDDRIAMDAAQDKGYKFKEHKGLWDQYQTGGEGQAAANVSSSLWGHANDVAQKGARARKQTQSKADADALENYNRIQNVQIQNQGDRFPNEMTEDISTDSLEQVAPPAPIGPAWTAESARAIVARSPLLSRSKTKKPT